MATEINNFIVSNILNEEINIQNTLECLIQVLKRQN